MNIPAQAITRYITEVDKIYRTGNATEHSYRPALKTLFENLTKGLTITNEPKHIDCGAPDYIITRNSIPVGYIEAKDISVGLDHKANNEQFNRYKQSLGNLIITDYLTFRLFVEGNQLVSVTIACESGGNITPDKKQYDTFLEMINRFTCYSGKTIYQSLELARMMADKAKLLAEVIKAALSDKAGEGDTLSGQLEGFRKILIHNLSETDFADMYAQTLAYGLFAARLNQRDTQTFNRMIAAHLVPKSNPFLRKFFQYIAGFDLDSRIRWIVDALADLFNCVAIEDILKEFGRANQDPYIHFYETFLAEYDPTLRESRGVYYTPLPVVQFIVKAVDNILQKEFGLAQGLADNSKVRLPIKGTDKQGNLVTVGEREFHKVQILDPAAGTGTFLAEVLNAIYSRFAGQQGMWAGYCEEHLIPRLNGFEILMASYAMAHFKLDMTLRETGYSSEGDSRLRVFLTNSLEEPEDIASKFPMVEWLTQEANEANNVKKDTPVMVILGNPPYSGISQNNGKWITDLIEDYKYIDGVHFNERKHWLHDDYVKFIRYGQYFIDRNGEGILAYINNHSFLDNPTFRGMRWNVLQTFDKIYIIDLHGNAKKKETAPDGGKDENVFDIQQGVSINIYIKTGRKEKNMLAEVYHFDLYGKRKEKCDYLVSNKLLSVPFVRIEPVAPFYFMMPKNETRRGEYEKGFVINDIFKHNVTGTQTGNDNLLMAISKENLKQQIKNSYNTTVDEIYLREIAYRPFDYRYMYYVESISKNNYPKITLPASYRSRYKIMNNFLNSDNCGLIAGRQGQVVGGMLWNLVFITQNITDLNMFYRGGGMTFPLYLYPDKEALDKTEERRPNLNTKIINKVEEKIKLRFTNEKTDDNGTFVPIDILDYIYAVLHSPTYRTQYREFLKIDFPRIPYPVNIEQFKNLVELGAILRHLHLLEGITPSKNLARYPVEGSNTVDGLAYKDEKVWINKHQYFEKIPMEAWNFYIGGYQPAQKWLKDRKGRSLTFDDIQHYQKIINVLYLTGDIQKRIDGVMNE
jgi:predicted helicase